MLFTVTATFSDFTFAVEQYAADAPEMAVKRFVERAVALAEYDRSAWLAAPDDALGLVHIGGGLRGAWIWSSRVDLTHDDVALHGGVVVQTDSGGAVRRDAP
jgi:hypothetical protein